MRRSRSIYYILQVSFFMLMVLYWMFTARDGSVRDPGAATLITGIPSLLATMLQVDVILLFVLCVYMVNDGRQGKVSGVNFLLLLCNCLYAAAWWDSIMNEQSGRDDMQGWFRFKAIMMVLLSLPTLIYSLYILIWRNKKSGAR